MNSKFNYLFKMSLKKKVKSKWFVIVNIILCIALVLLLNINSIISFFGGDFDSNTKILVVDKANSYPMFEANVDALKELGEIDNIEIKEVDSYKEKNLHDDEVVVELNDTDFSKAKIVSSKKIDARIYQVLVQGLNATRQSILLANLNISSEDLANLSKQIEIDRVVLSEEKGVDENMDLIMNTVFPTLILPFFMLIIFLVQMVGGEICEEKTTKSMEIIISNVSPQKHLLAKILASNLFVILQGVLLFVYGVIGLLISRSLNGFTIPSEVSTIFNSLADSGFISDVITLIPFAIILMILSFLAYSITAGILASMTTNMEDFSQVQTPIMIMLLASYYLSIMAGMFNGSSLIKILSYVPFLSCLISPSLFMMGQIGVIDILISIGILIVFIVIILKYGLKIYKIGILNYSNEKVWTRFRKALKSKEV